MMQKLTKLLIAMLLIVAVCLVGFTACSGEREKEFSKFVITFTLTDKWEVSTDNDIQFSIHSSGEKPTFITVHKHTDSNIANEEQMRAKVVEHITWRYSEMLGTNGNYAIGLPKMSYDNGRFLNAHFAYGFWYATEEAKQGGGTSGVYMVIQTPDNIGWFSIMIVDYDFSEDKALNIMDKMAVNFS